MTDATRLTPELVRSLLEAATPGPWSVRGFGCVRRANGSTLAEVADSGSTSQTLSDAALIAAAPDIARAYIEARAEIDAMLAKVAEYEGDFARLEEARDEAYMDRDAADAKAERAYARGALDMRARAAAVCSYDVGIYANERDSGREDQAEVDRVAIEALDVDAPGRQGGSTRVTTKPLPPATRARR